MCNKHTTGNCTSAAEVSRSFIYWPAPPFLFPFAFAFTGCCLHHLDRRLLHPTQPHKVHPQQRADKGVPGPDDERQDVAQLVIPLKEDLNAALLNNPRHNLVPQVAGHGHVHPVRRTGLEHILGLVGGLEVGVKGRADCQQGVGDAHTWGEGREAGRKMGMAQASVVDKSQAADNPRQVV